MAFPRIFLYKLSSATTGDIQLHEKNISSPPYTSHETQQTLTCLKNTILLVCRKVGLEDGK